MLDADLPAALAPDPSLVETFLRGTFMYFFIYFLLRVVLRGRTGATTTSDLLVLVLIADAAQNAMAADYSSVTNGATLVATIIGWSFALDWIGYRVPLVQSFVHPDRKPLIVDGRLIRPTLARELITEEELMSQLRLQGVDDVQDVKSAFLEGNGEISVIKRSGGEDGGHRESPGAT
jgi:uncharacterized membrane protein YcaP (DUF421 family)